MGHKWEANYGCKGTTHDNTLFQREPCMDFKYAYICHLRMAKEIEKLVKSLNDKYDALSQKQADYLSMDTSQSG